MEAKVIFVSIVKSNKSDNKVWTVAVTGEEKSTAFCKSAYKAMRFAFLLKKRTGGFISKKSISLLSEGIKEEKAAKAAAVQEAAQEIAESHSVDNILAQPEEVKAEEPKKKERKPRAKKNAEAAQVVALI